MAVIKGSHLFSDKTTKRYWRFGGDRCPGLSEMVLKAELIELLPKKASLVDLFEVTNRTRSGRVCARYEALI